MDNNISCQMKIETGEAGYVLEDVPHLTDYIPDLPICRGIM
ncbi:putative 6-phosphofructokinase [Helianthus annuus]|uniref:6-phosphofructokinase n=1 Tax=Helianthus annuus TaxID=4232 RepID=A0A9K3NKB5_HELAN|nr:putative 6-phosphofructokinase [Helianthus annuus]KAJ0916460.1 putative 6-phosphofructokinase [Helianthus annuus]